MPQLQHQRLFIANTQLHMKREESSFQFPVKLCKQLKDLLSFL